MKVEILQALNRKAIFMSQNNLLTCFREQDGDLNTEETDEYGIHQVDNESLMAFRSDRNASYTSGNNKLQWPIT